MAIKGLTDKINLDQAQDRVVRLGFLQKGAREEFGAKIKLYDYDYFGFKPAKGQDATALSAIFEKVYGAQPYEINDVRIPVDVAGNFNIEDCAWLTASKHTAKGSMFLAKSNGEWIKMARNPNDGRKVEYFYDGQKAHTPEGYVYGGNVYPWQHQFAIDLVLNEFNAEVARQAMSGQGVVTFITHSLNDISTLIAEYNGILNNLANLISNPMKAGDFNQAKRYMPLRSFPLRLFRSTQNISTPDWKEKGPSDKRIMSERSLVHWQLSPEFAIAAQKALDARTSLMLKAVETMPMLGRGDVVKDINADLFGDDTPAALPSKTKTVEPQADGISPVDDMFDEIPEGEFEEYQGYPTQEMGKPDIELWEASLGRSQTADDFATAFYQLNRPAFDNALQCKKALVFICGEFDRANVDAYIKAMDVYAQVMADMGQKSIATNKAIDEYKRVSAPF